MWFIVSSSLETSIVWLEDGDAGLLEHLDLAVVREPEFVGSSTAGPPLYLALLLALLN